MRTLRGAGTGILLMFLASACSVASPADSRPDDATFESEDPAEALLGRAVAGLGPGGTDVVFRIGEDGFRLPEDEFVIEIHGDRVLSARRVPHGANTRLIVRDLGGGTVREIDPGMQVAQTAIVRGDDVFYAGIDVTYDSAGSIESLIDRGAWVARGNARPEPIYAPELPVVYSRMQLSPDGQTVGFTRCDKDCSTTLVGMQSGTLLEILKPELIALANDAALVIAPYGETNQVIAYALADGAELWRAVDGTYFGRYATTDGNRFVLSAGGTSEPLRIEIFDANAGAVLRTVKLPDEPALRWLEPSLSTDRYAAIIGSVVPNVDEGPHSVNVVDLEAGELLDLALNLGDVP